jgi:DNA-binding transcriptional MocR family regulator
MTPAEERQFIRLWQAEASYREIAQALGCALGTVGSRAAALVAQGKIQPRPRGGAYPRQHAPPIHPPVQSSAEQDSAVQSGAESPPTALVPAVASAAIIDLLRQTLAPLGTVRVPLQITSPNIYLSLSTPKHIEIY